MKPAPKWARQYDWAAYDRSRGTSINAAVMAVKPSLEKYVAHTIGQKIDSTTARMLHKLSKRSKIGKKIAARLSMTERGWLVLLMEANQQGGYTAYCKKITHQW